MKNFSITAGLLCLCMSLGLTAQAATATFQTIADPIANTWSNYAISGDGTVMAANYGGEIYRWTAEGGFQDLGPGDPYSSSIGISRDGSTIISGRIGQDGFSSPTIWNAKGAVDLGHPRNGCTKIGNSWGSGYGLNANGKVAVGLAWTCNAAEGFKWTPKTGTLSLGHPLGNHSSRASAISANGKAIVGFWEDPTGPRRPVRWIAGKRDLFLGKNTIGEATAVNSNGKQIVGQAPDSSGYGVRSSIPKRADWFRWVRLSGSIGDQSVANGVSDTGRVVGWSGDPFGNGIEAFSWTRASGMKKLASVLRKMGAKIPATAVLTTADSISADGSTMVGQYYDGQTFGNWIAHITQ